MTGERKSPGRLGQGDGLAEAGAETQITYALSTKFYLADKAAGIPWLTRLAFPLHVVERIDRHDYFSNGHLHQELYADDGTAKADNPYSVTEQSYAVRLVQTSAGARHGVFLVLPRETVSTHSERNPADPRVTHELVLDVDPYGNVTRKAAVAYGRATGEPEQKKEWATLTESSFVNSPDFSPAVDFYRIGLPSEETSYELVEVTLPKAGQGLVGWQTLKDAVAGIDAAHSFAYDQTPTGSGPKRRMLDRKQQLYGKDDQTGPLLLGQIESLALPYETYQLALTSGLVDEIVSQSQTLSGTAFDPALLLSEGHYVQRPGDTGYWTRSGRVVFDASKFYLPVELVDPFDKHHFVTYDSYSLLVTTTRDPLGNIVQAENDYRVLGPKQVTDPNLNRAAVEFDALGMVVKSVVMGKDGTAEGDTFEQPGSTLEYDLLRWSTQHLPAVVHTTVCEQHRQDTPVQHSYAYSDGFGRVVMQKVQAEPDPATPTTPRWVGTGRTVFNNKGNPVKQYEPFFSTTSEFEAEASIVETGVTPIIHYDPLDRVIRTELPNKTESRVDYDTWSQTSYDPNDTVKGSQWYVDRGSPDPAGSEPSDPETRAAWLAARHDDTPTVTHVDSLGRAFLVEETNRTYANGGPPTEETLRTRTTLDIEGNALAIIDARQAALNPRNPLPAQRQRFDVLSRVLRTDSVDAGARLGVADVGHKPLRGWDNRGQTMRADFDDLQRPSRAYVKKGADEKVVMRTVYGESLDPTGTMPTDPTNPSPAQQQNLRGQAYLVFDGAGLVKNEGHDFKGNLLQSSRRLAKAYQTTPEWTALPDGTPTQIETAASALLESEIFTASTTYDALNRVVTHTTPDTSVTSPAYNEAGLLESLTVSVRGAAAGTVIANIDYNAKGQRILCEYADPTASGITCRTVYTYDRLTFRLASIVTNRLASATVTAAKLQDLRYIYDPVGNIVELDDRADTAPIFSGTTPVSGDGRYRYDSIYRLIQAEGREHPGQAGTSTQPRAEYEVPMASVPHANDLQALIRYLEKYTYDQVGNIQRVAHTTTAAGGGTGPAWTRSYNYGTDSNRLLGTSEPGDPDGTFSATYAYDEHGSMTRMSHLPVIDWDHADHMQHANKGGGGDVYFAYDAAGQRVRKVYEHTGLVDERIYLGGYEIYRKRSATTLQLERQTLHVMDDQRRVTMVETKTVDVDTGPGTSRWRLQLDNHLGSSMLELAETGKVITYEEYHPYGTTAFQSSDGSAEVSAKRYRYTGKEKDEETGLYYHGARYYAPWLGRWTAADPAGMVDGANLYCYGRSCPTVRRDPNGMKSGAEKEDVPATAPPPPDGKRLPSDEYIPDLGAPEKGQPGKTPEEVGRADLDAKFRKNKLLRKRVYEAAEELHSDPGLLGASLFAENAGGTDLSKTSGKVATEIIGLDDWFQPYMKAAIRRLLKQHPHLGLKYSDVQKTGRMWNPGQEKHPDGSEPVLKPRGEVDATKAVAAVAAFEKAADEILRNWINQQRTKHEAWPAFDDLAPDQQLTLQRLTFNAGQGHAKRLYEEIAQGGDIPRSGGTQRDKSNLQGVRRTAVLHVARAIHLSQEVFGRSPENYQP